MALNSGKVKVISPQPNYWLTVFSLAIVLLLGAIPFFISLQVPQFVRYIQDNSFIGVSFENEPSNEQKKELEAKLGEYRDHVASGKWVERDQAWNMMKSDFPEMVENPLNSMFMVKLRKGWDDLAFQHGLTEQLKALEFVDQVYIPPVQFEQIRKNIRLLSFGLGILGLIALGGAAILIYFTIRLSIYDKRFSIRTLELVGADWTFIQRPFVKRGLRIGILSALLSSVILVVLVIFWMNQSDVLKAYIDWSALLWSLAVINILGPFVGLLTSLYTVNRFLQGGLDELFNT